LIVATHGRSFWILDDFTPLRQLNDEVAKSAAHLFAPQKAIRFRWNRNPDTPLPPESRREKSSDGAIIDYYLASVAKDPVTLEIFDSQNHLVRRFSSTDKPIPMEKLAAENPIPMYWLAGTILSPEPGMHRFVWNLHYAPPDALEHEFPISAIYRDTPRYPLGAWVCRRLHSEAFLGSWSFAKTFSAEIDRASRLPLSLCTSSSKWRRSRRGNERELCCPCTREIGTLAIENLDAKAGKARSPIPSPCWTRSARSWKARRKAISSGLRRVPNHRRIFQR